MITFSLATHEEVESDTPDFLSDMKGRGSLPKRMEDSALRISSNPNHTVIKGVDNSGRTVLYIFGQGAEGDVFAMAGGMFRADTDGSTSFYHADTTHRGLMQFIADMGHTYVHTVFIAGTPMFTAFKQNQDLYTNLVITNGDNNQRIVRWDLPPAI